MDKTSSSTVKLCLKSPEKRSLKLRRQRCVDDSWSTSRRKSFREKHSLDSRMVQSCGPHMRIRTSRRAKVLYKPKDEMKIVMVTLSSPEKTPSPDIFSGFDIDVKGSHFQKLCSPKNCEKSIKLFFDTSEEPTNPDVIVKENKKEVERIPINELLDIQDEHPKRLYGTQISLNASQPEWSPDIRIYDYKSGYLCERELMFLQKRKKNIQTALRKLFDEDEEIHSQSSVPHIALMGSGGGYRAMVAMSGIVNALYDEKLLDYILYTSVLSGSSWYIATLYSHPDWPNIDPRKVQKKMKADISKNPKTLSNLFYYGWDAFKKRKIYRQEWNFTTHVFGPMLGHVLISDMTESHLVLKPRHSLVGKGLLPMILEVKSREDDIPVGDLARLKKDHPLQNYSLDELTVEFRKLTGEALKDVLLLAGKDVNLENGLQILHHAILFANLIGGPKSSTLTTSDPGPSSSVSTSRSATLITDIGPYGTSRGATQTSQGTAGTPSSVSSSNTDIEGRLQKIETNFDNLKNGQVVEKVSEALKSVRALASRPKLTSQSVLIAALEYLVECAHKANHSDTEFYSKTLQACRQFENHNDLCSLCLKLLGSSEDRKVSTAIAEWQKTVRKSEKNEERVDEKSGYKNPPSCQVVPGAPSFPYPCPPFPFQYPMGFSTGFPSGPSLMPFSGDMNVPRHPGFRPRPRRPRGSCFYCKESGHHIDACPKIKKE